MTSLSSPHGGYATRLIIREKRIRLLRSQQKRMRWRRGRRAAGPAARAWRGEDAKRLDLARHVDGPAGIAVVGNLIEPAADGERQTDAGGGHRIADLTSVAQRDPVIGADRDDIGRPPRSRAG